MKPANPDQQKNIEINYMDLSFPENVRRIRPAVWCEEKVFCVLSGPDSGHGIFGCGATLYQALEDWNRHVAEKRSYGELKASDLRYMQAIKVAC